ncbi:MAG: EAL domain-containing protein [Erythrobacter sp.]|nr:EAL domain-containing protein [Erythrobacter sp.]NCQ22720.1 EAL domain-containing protein [Sphingomonadales bacterium]
MRAIFQLFDLDNSDPELSREQFRSFQGHIPLLYGILLCNTVAITVTAFDRQHFARTLFSPLAICVFVIVRAIWWLRQGSAKQFDDAQIARHLGRTCAVPVVMTLIFNLWVVWVFQDAGAYARSNLTFFLALSQVSTVFCLMTLRAAAMRVAVVSTVSFALYFSWVEGGQLLPQSLVLCCVCGGMAVVTHSFNRSFSEVVQSRRTLHNRQLETEKLSEKNRRIAFSDPLSGLANRRELLARLDRFDEHQHLRADSLAIIFFDLDGFKQVNDEHGHQAGDELIRTVCHRLLEQCPGHAILARVGGDEFTVLLEADDGTDGAEAVALMLATRLLEQMALPVLVDRHVLQISGSIGIASNTDEKAHPRELLRRADMAMYHAKTQGKAQIAIYNEELDQGRLRSIEIEGQIGSGLGRGEFDIAYQPIIDAASGAIVATEALLRWPRRAQGSLPPDEFIEVAEATGQIHSLGLYVLERACRDIGKLPGLGLSVNVSPAQFRHPGFEGQVLNILRRTGFPPERLQLEMTESYLLTNPGLAIRATQALRAAGISLALDDFGTGFTSIHYLKSYGFTHIKIDKSLLNGLEPGSKAAMLVSGAILLASALDMNVIAEGVENETQAHVLRALDCHEMQGYLFGKPVPLSEFRRFLAPFGDLEEHAPGLRLVR